MPSFWRRGPIVVAGQIAGIASTEFGLSNMIWAAVVIGKVNSRGLTRHFLMNL